MEEMFERLSSTIVHALSSAMQQMTSAIMSAIMTQQQSGQMMVPSLLPLLPSITSLNPSSKNMLFDITPTTMLNKPLSSSNITSTKKT
ncbi:unnamed protein product [Didymodactylos carnosus]|uniref:Uncharacterized protein n=1 Tax=Didymodactylos carnosus TaxID=1234261 RepID=A0A813PNF7_9BILA|nr:unnamed protein product [Didymodactylos carnosus]CAF1094708.1 unnamed protein product [Didymodactylos carnosus]CAF3537086.1 unnamed protein product [Didymodactylos carnosus]CAF3856204.1 unnamed protein product [Didymodactylos carnosus]